MSERVRSNFENNQEENVGSRDLAKAILDVRSTEVMRKQNRIMIILTIVITILTGLLVYKEFCGDSHKESQYSIQK